MFIIGHTRFSVYSFGGGERGGRLAATNTTEEEYRAWLYDDERMRARTEVFTEEVLPQLELAIGKRKDIVHVVSHSSNLPEPYLSALKAAQQRYSFVRLIVQDQRAEPQLPPDDLVKELLGWHPGNRIKFAGYRLDDDDLISKDYFRRMMRYLAIARTGWKISFGYGYSAIRSDGQYYYLRYDRSSFPSAGLMALFLVDEDGTLLGNERHGPHTKSDWYAPVITDSTKPAFFRGRNHTQDSLVKAQDKRQFLRRAHDRLKTHDPAPSRRVIQQFPVLKDRLHSEMGNPRERVDLITQNTPVDSSGLELQPPHELSCILGVMVDAPLERHELVIKLSYADSAEAAVTDDHLLPELRAHNVRYSSSLGYWAPVPHDELGSRKYVLLPSPENFQITNMELVARNAPVTIRRVESFPWLTLKASRA